MDGIEEETGRTRVPERAIVPRFSTSSFRVIPIPVSSSVSVLPADRHSADYHTWTAFREMLAVPRARTVEARRDANL